MILSNSFKQKIVGAFGEGGKAWLETLEERVQACAKKWGLTVYGTINNLSYNYVTKAVDSKKQPVILKIGIPNFDFENEIRTLQAYNGDGCVRLIDSDPELGGMVLEQLIPGTMLTEIVDEQQAIFHFINVWKAIRWTASSTSNYPTILDWAEGLNRYLHQFPNSDGPIPSKYISLAKDCFDYISDTSAVQELLHGDLHHENILYSEKHGWIAIDPKGVAGDRYFDLISFLTNQLHHKPDPREVLRRRIDTLVKELGLEQERLLKAAFAMSVLYACWGLEDKSEWENVYQCAQWFHEFYNEGR
ncbi:aminoglycoside phosphotransferase family protein [Neobacillus muris]|uniref:aminoglycoside phosphotransferase family protein n=1 Tax=Neobacillus muris TaxID=2941334 RepID=UPI00203EA5A3|nr:aminoglycoside phosphotransferase family protein [Neobacillus muris]